MKIPKHKFAVISESKIQNYILSNTHPIGRTKAAFFNSVGFNIENEDFLANELKKLIDNSDIDMLIENNFGKKYIVGGSINSPTGINVEITTVWFIEKDNTIPYFVTAYPKRKR